jgi:Uma2 family endonuclease
MASEPDIIVTGPDASDVALIVEVKLSNQTLEDSERQLKAYMAALGSPVGLLVTPQRLQLYQDRYLPSLEDSIARVGDFDVNNILRFRSTQNVQADSFDFERSVQSWLEGLSTESGLKALSPELRRAAQRYIVPALAQGIVRSGHPRFQTRN